jgi:hypothetical protein
MGYPNPDFKPSKVLNGLSINEVSLQNHRGFNALSMTYDNLENLHLGSTNHAAQIVTPNCWYLLIHPDTFLIVGIS